MCCEIVPLAFDEVHDQERNVTENIYSAQICIEFDTVKCRDAIRQTNQVSQVQIAMAIPDEASIETLRQHFIQPFQFGLRPFS